MFRSSRILSVLSTLSLLANGSLAFAQDPASTGTIAPREVAGPVPPQDAAGTVSPQDAAGTVPPQDAAGTVSPQDAAGTVPPQDAAGTVPPQDAAALVPPRDSARSVPPQDAAKAVAPQDSAATNSQPAEPVVEKPAPVIPAAKSPNVPGRTKSSYVKEEPMSDPAGSPKRVHRPGQEAVLPPTAPPIARGSPTPASPMPLLNPPPPAPPKERFPSLGQLEQLMFGHSTPTIVVDNRLDKLETAIFQKNFPELDIEQRIRRLKEVIVGEDSPQPQASSSYGDPARSAYSRPATTFPLPKTLGMTLPDLERDPVPAPFFPNYGHYDLNQQLSIPEAEKFAADVLNEVRQQQGLNELSWDDKAFIVAAEQVADLVNRDAVSHQNAKGENPDLRYTQAGGSDALVESTMMFPAAAKLRPTRQLVVKILEALHSRQDDRDSLMSTHASGFSMAFQWNSDRQKLICCTEVVTKHGQMEPLPLEAAVGDKIEVKGSVAAPYKFQKITLAWEGLSTSPPDDSSESSEALPYFPPLDYEVHASKSNKDFDKGVKILQFAGIAAALAGGLFIPPIALAAPLIAASIGSPMPKAVSEIPVKGGVKTDGSNFSGVISLSNQSKEGIYYVTVWASTGTADESIAISRRTIIAHKERPARDSGNSKEEPKGEDKKDDDEKQTQQRSI